MVAFSLAHRGAEFIGPCPRNGDNVVPHCRELARNPQAQPSASAGDNDVTHVHVPSSPWH